MVIKNDFEGQLVAAFNRGVLPKPPLWEKHRTLLRAEDKIELEKIVVVSVKGNRKDNEIIELGDKYEEIEKGSKDPILSPPKKKMQTYSGRKSIFDFF